MIILPKPTIEQLDKINKFTLTPLTEDDCYVFPNLMIDNLPTSYYSIIQDNLLRKFSVDVKKGVGLLLSHNSNKLPVGKSFDSSLVEEYDTEKGEYVKTLYGDFYIALGRNTESGMTTDDIVKGIDSGTMSDTSIGFSAKDWECSICGNDIRDYWSCSHYPGRKYVKESESEGEPDTVETCYVLVGGDGDGELLENSLVYAGACDRASVINRYSKTDVKDLTTKSKLHLVEDIKNIPLDATMYQFYAKDGTVLMVDTDVRTNGTEILDKRGGEKMELDKILTEFNLKDLDEVKEVLSKANAFAEELTAKNEELSAKIAELENSNSKIVELEGELGAINSSLEDEKNLNTELKATNEALLANKEMVENYRKDLTDEVLTLGVRVQGNLFNKDLYEKFLNTLTIDELKETKESFSKGVTEKFDGTRTTQPKVNSKENNGELFRDDFETEEEFRNYVSDKATEYSKVSGVSIKEATKEMYAKYIERGDE